MTTQTEDWIWRAMIVLAILAILAMTAWAAFGATSQPEWAMPTAVRWVRVTATDAKGKVFRLGPLLRKTRVDAFCDGIWATPTGNERRCAIHDASPDLTYRIEGYDRWKRPIGPAVTCQRAADGWTCR